MARNHRGIGLGRFWLAPFIAVALLAACGPAAPTSVSPSPSAVSATVTLTDSGCEYAGPSDVPVGPVGIDLVNETTGQFDLDLWRLNEGHEYDELAAHIAEELRRVEAGEPGLGHPTFATLVAEATADAGESGELTTELAAGTYGMACQLFPAPGELGGIWAVGPLTASG